MSTSLAVLQLVENITSSIDDCKSNVGVFVDLKGPLILLTMTFSEIVIKNVITMVYDV